MRKTTDRRHFLQAALTLGGVAAIPGLQATPAAPKALAQARSNRAVLVKPHPPAVDG